MSKKTKYNIKIFFSIIEVILTVLFVLTFAIAIPIFARSFYYWNIDLLEIEYWTGYSRETIIQAYDNIMDFLVFNGPYSTAPLPSSASGQAHFEDCKVLFTLDFAVLGISVILLILLYIIRKYVLKINYLRFSPYLTGTSILIGILAIIGIFGINDFETLFNGLHKILFPGKDNWVFNTFTDPIVNILPLELWLNFIYLIIAIILFIFLLTLTGYIHKRRKYPKIANTLILYDIYSHNI